MKRQILGLFVGMFFTSLPVLRSSAATYYVNAGNPAPVSPYTSWVTAATNIQDAINVSTNGDTILVTNGIYQYGGAIMAGSLSNRVALYNPVTVESVNGPWVTTIYGAGATNGATAMRCAWLTNGATLTGFTLQGGATLTSGDLTTENGGAAWCASSNALVANCVIVSNTAYSDGGGVYQGTVINSLVSSNGTHNAAGGATYQAVLQNCTLVSNATFGVASPIAMTNCIIYFNNPTIGNYTASGRAFSHCCTTPALSGTGNFTNAPNLFVDGVHLTTNSPCVGAGIAPVSGTDLFGQPWANPPSIGCAELQASPIVAPPQIQFAGFPASLAIGAVISGQPPFSCFWLENGLPLQDNGHVSGTQTASLTAPDVIASDAGAYQLVVSNSYGMVTSVVAQLVIHCVNVAGASPAPPYTGWATAATNIQDAINASTNGDLILVTNGVYQYGGAIVSGSLSNRVALYTPVTMESVNGPWVTTIYGAGATNGATAVRCAWLTNGAALDGFTLQGGATLNTGDSTTYNGGGAWCASSNALIANCVIVSNTAGNYGGGVYQGTVINSLVSSNGSSSSGTYGALYQTVLNNCTVVNNANFGVWNPIAMTNCIIYYNNGNGSGENYSGYVGGGGFSYCCTTPVLPGMGNITNAPDLFVDGVHLTTNSPCVRAGIAPASGTDLFGQSWANPPSMGCAELQPEPIVATPQLHLTGNPVGFTAGAVISGQPPFSCFWLENGAPLQNNGQFSGTQTASLTAVGVNFSDASGYQLVVSNSYGMVTSAVAQLVIHCVNVAGTSPVPPYTAWATATTNIQDAINAAAAGEVVLVTNGIYATGGISMDGVITNRISVNKAILVDSVNGPGATVIQGAWDPTSTNGAGAVRCAWLTTNTILDGFTLCGGATRSVSASVIPAMSGGGIYGTSTSAIVYNCVIVTNFAGYEGGGAYRVTLNNCVLTRNVAMGSGTPGSGVGNAGSGGGAELCGLNNCSITSNAADQENGGGADNCSLRNCAVVGNSCYLSGGGANGGSLVNCTVVSNTASGYSTGYGAAVYSAVLTNCIVYDNFSRTSYPNTNYASCTLAYCCTDPLPTGPGNIDVNPQLLGDDIHLAGTSLCIGAGLASAVFGTDIDGQTWNNPPSIGCDEWQPTPLIVGQPGYQVNTPLHGLTFNVIVAGQTPFNFFWSQNSNSIQDDGHHNGSGTANLTINNFGPADGGAYQVVVSNAFGVVTSQVAPLVIHAVNIAGSNPVPPYTSWATAATDIQDAVNASAAGDIVLVTNGFYSTGGMVMSGGLTNRVAVTQPITVTSVNGYSTTFIQGAWDPVTTNGPDAVRCAWLANGALLNGFTLQNGATFSSGDGSGGGPLESGGGIYCLSANGVVSDCVLSNNSAVWGGAMVNGTLINSLVYANHAAQEGGGIYDGILNNCTVEENYLLRTSQGAGIYGSPVNTVRNSIVVNNYDYPTESADNSSPPGGTGPTYSYTCIPPPASGTGNTNVNPQFLDWFHIASTSPCVGAGDAAYSSGTDLDGEAWNNPPSMGCDEVVPADLVGPLSVTLDPLATNLVLNRVAFFFGFYTGRAATIGWSFGDGTTATNSNTVNHEWGNSGSYPVTFTVYNSSYPAGVSATVMVQVEPLLQPQLQFTGVEGGAFQFQFPAQNANYTIQYTTNLTPPISWHTLQMIYANSAGVVQVSDPATTNAARFYRVLAQ